MNKLAAIAASLSILFAAPCFAAAIDDAFEIYKRGDYAAAMKAFRTLADQGNANAQFNLAVMYAQGQGVPQSEEEAHKWYRLSASHGFPEAQVIVGIMYDRGNGVPQDLVEGARWQRLAAAQGNLTAQAALGSKYFFGHGVEKDYVRAFMWFTLAADAGSMSSKKGLENLVPQMTRAQLEEGRARVVACKRQELKGCD
jgi:hypothetical protein